MMGAIVTAKAMALWQSVSPDAAVGGSAVGGKVRSVLAPRPGNRAALGATR